MAYSVSVIIPIYNAEKWLKRCVDSVLSQSLQDIEILLIDDGSFDDSGLICDRYSKTNPKVKAFHKKNEGIADTRQFGLEKASGEYIIFLDSDDYVSPDMYSTLYKKAKEQQADLVYSDWYSIEGDRFFYDRFHFPSWTREGLLKGYLKNQPGFLVTVLIRRSLFAELHVSLGNLYNVSCEDKINIVTLLSTALRNNRVLKIAYVPKAFYYYDKTINPNSSMKKNTQELYKKKVSDWKTIKEIIDSDKFGKYHAERLVEYAFYAIWNKLYDETTFKTLYEPFTDYIRSFSPPSSRKRIVLIALNQGVVQALEYKWIAYPFLLREKTRLFIRKLFGSRMH